MPRIFKAPALDSTSGGDGPEPKTLFATDKPPLLTFSLFIICPFILRCLPFFFFFSFFLIILVLAIPTATPTPSSLCSPQPPPLSRSLDYVEPESGKVSLWKQGQRQWRALYGRERGGNRRRQKERKKTENWPVLRNPRVVISRRSDSKKKKKTAGREWIVFTGERWEHRAMIWIPNTLLNDKCLFFFLSPPSAFVSPLFSVRQWESYE